MQPALRQADRQTVYDVGSAIHQQTTTCSLPAPVNCLRYLGPALTPL